MNILYLYADQPYPSPEWNSSNWRCSIPASAFQKSQVHNSSMTDIGSLVIENPKATEFAEWADTIVFQRLFIGPTLECMEYWKARGKTIIGDVDDGYGVMPSTVVTYDYWKKGLVKTPQGLGRMRFTPYDQLVWGAKLCHAISAPSKVLVEDWKSIAPMSIYIPNFPQTKDYLQYPKSVPTDEEIVIGWGGGGSHLASFKFTGVVQALIRILNEMSNVVFFMAGGNKEVIELFRNKVNEKQVRIKSWGSYSEWPKTLAQFHIGLIPLHGAYDERRSPIKSLEYSLMSIPWVGSKSASHDVFGKYGVQVNNTREEWYTSIKDMIVNYKDHLDTSLEAFDLAMSWDINKNLDYIVDKYSEVAYTIQPTRRY